MHDTSTDCATASATTQDWPNTAVAVGARSLDAGHLGSHVPDVRLKRDGLPHAVAVTTAEVTGSQGGAAGPGTVQIARRSELHTFKVIPRRWIFERSFAWLEKNRRLAVEELRRL